MTISLDFRRFFRNRFEYYLDYRDGSGAGVHDGSALTFRELCNALRFDPEPFPRHYDGDMRKVCGHEYLTWFREGRTYGDVARVLDRKLAGEAGELPPVSGRWVHAALNSAA